MGVNSLRVVDGSTFRVCPGTNPQATTMMLGRVTPHVQFNYFSHPKDLSQCVSAVKKIGESDESAMEEFCRSSVTTIWNYHGGCTVGKVVDGDFRVMGVNSLRVVDGSTFRVCPGTNPQATTMMLGRRNFIGCELVCCDVAGVIAASVCELWSLEGTSGMGSDMLSLIHTYSDAKYPEMVSFIAAYILSLFLIILCVNNFHHQQQVLALASSGSDHDFRYMKSVHDATEMSLEEEYYDYIIIGGGTAGCPLAATLSENYSVLVLERGSVPTANPNVLHLHGFFANLMQEEEETRVTPAQRFTSEDGVENARGRVLGGTSMINAGFFSRGDEGFFSKPGVKWRWMDRVEKAYEWVEESIVFRPKLPLWQSSFRDALLEIGVGPDNEFDLNHKLGTKISGSTFDEVGRRHGAVELLNKGNLNNLKVVVHATVEKSSSLQKKIYHSGDDNDHDNNPPRDFIADNPRNNINLIIPSPTDPSPVQVVGITNHYFIETISANLPASLTPLPFSVYPKSSTAHLGMTVICEKLRQPLSSGSLWLASPNDVRVTPHVRFNYFSHPKDLSQCVNGVRKIGGDMSRQWKNFVESGQPYGITMADAQLGKVDGDFRVMGVNSLRVVDGSTFRVSPGTNPQATVMMLGPTGSGVATSGSDHAGCPLAATLSENYSVLVLERGSVPTSNPNVLHLSRVLGGSSMINAGFFSRGDEGFYSKSGVKWEMDRVEKAYEWVEESIVFRPKLPVWQSSFRDALLEVGVGPNNGFDLNHKLGTKISGSTFDEVGRRHGAVELLNKGNLNNLKVVVHATVDRIIFSTKVSSNYHSGDDSDQNSPRDFIADNPRNNINLIIPFPTELPHMYPKSSTANLGMAIICEKLRHPLSSGSLWLASSNDVRVTPHVRFNYFSHPKDLSQCVSAVRKISEVFKQQIYGTIKMVDLMKRNFMYFGPSLPTNQSNESAMEEFCRSSVTTIWHYHGGCTVGKVVDGDFRVMGLIRFALWMVLLFVSVPGPILKPLP
ncbi:hypothetical protein G4B88_001012 [Cannabis sativa]|uniref:(R)-mandelonitrile lyase n=1 Tax=Cannabis sativa TaxID=3483 RepID=A0A7J6FBY0_CANSA|nr:hypothetical protein G4B88_001012 [Cannabis sativa]